MPAGRPTKYRPEYCQMLIEHMATGKSYETFVTKLDYSVSVATLYNWENKFPEFLEAKKRAFIECQNTWEDFMLANAMGDIKSNPAILVYNMKCRFGGIWKSDIVPDPEPLKEEKFDELPTLTTQH